MTAFITDRGVAMLSWLCDSVGISSSLAIARMREARLLGSASVDNDNLTDFRRAVIAYGDKHGGTWSAQMTADGVNTLASTPETEERVQCALAETKVGLPDWVRSQLAVRAGDPDRFAVEMSGNVEDAALAELPESPNAASAIAALAFHVAYSLAAHEPSTYSEDLVDRLRKILGAAFGDYEFLR